MPALFMGEYLFDIRRISLFYCKRGFIYLAQCLVAVGENLEFRQNRCDLLRKKDQACERLVFAADFCLFVYVACVSLQAKPGEDVLFFFAHSHFGNAVFFVVVAEQVEH